MTARDRSTYRLQLTIERTGMEPRRVEVVAPHDASTGEVMDRLAAHLGLRGAEGGVFAVSVLSGAWVDRELPIASSGLLRGEHLRLSVGLASPEPGLSLRRWSEDSPAADASGCVPLNRPPRPAVPSIPAEVRIPKPPAPPRKRRFPLGALIVPLVLGAVLVVITKRPEVALFALFSPLMVLWNSYEDRHTGRTEFGESTVKHDERLSRVVAELEDATSRWAEHRRETQPSPAEMVERLGALSSWIWERRSGDPDFLELRVGTATRTAPIALRDDPTRDDVDSSETRDALLAALTVADVAASVALPDVGVAALVGSAPAIDDLVRWLLVQIAAAHSPRDVALAAVLQEAPGEDWELWLPQLADPLLDTNAVVFGDARARRLLSEITTLVRDRLDALESSRRAPSTTAVPLVLLLDARTGVDPSLCTEILEHGKRVGVYTIWIGEDARLAPGPSTILVALDVDGHHGQIVDHRNGSTSGFAADVMTAAQAEFCSQALAPLVDNASTARRTALPDRVRLDEIEPDLASPAARRAAWEAAPENRLVATIGVSSVGPFEVDLGQSGSSALVGGTNGSGKSELLQTIVTSLAASYSPDRVTFLLVDYKGGAAFKDAVNLPHTVGLVTDLDEHLTRRVLLSLGAEIRRREELLAGAGASSLSELRRADPTGATPNLLIVVDEFAALAKEIPEFVEGVVNIAALGRALGIRLVLATQRPAGVINDRIRANVALRIALRMNDESDSMDVIESRDAASISRATPGRALASLDRDVIEFQAAYVGAPTVVGVDAEISVRDLAEPDRFIVASEDPEPARASLLESVVDATNKIMSLGRWRQPDAPWHPPLPEVITLADLGEDLDGSTLPAGAVLLGRTDEPDRQRQRVLALDFDRHQNVLVYGTSRSGKTTVLRTIAAGLIARLGPSALSIYALDLAGHGLQTLAAAPQCGALIGGDDPGRMARLVRLFRREVDDRRRLLSERGRTVYADLFVDAELPVPPRIVVLIDSYAGLNAALERIDGGRVLESLQRLIADGPTVGVHFVITADRRAAVPGPVSAAIPTKIVLRMAERDDYALLGVDSELTRGVQLPAGRGFVQGTIEMQVAVASANPAGQAQLEQLGVIAAAAGSRSASERAPQVGAMPTDVRCGDLPTPAGALSVAIGIGDDALAPSIVDLTRSHFLVAGPSRSGRSTALATIASGLRAQSSPPRLVLVATRPTPLTTLDLWADVVANADDSSMEGALVRCDDDLRAGRAVVVVCDDADDLAESISVRLEAFARRGRDERIRVVAAAESRAALRTYSGLIPEIRKARQGLLLAPDLDLDGDLVGARLRAPVESLALAGRGFAVRDGVAELVQVAR